VSEEKLAQIHIVVVVVVVVVVRNRSSDARVHGESSAGDRERFVCWTASSYHRVVHWSHQWRDDLSQPVSTTPSMSRPQHLRLLLRPTPSVKQTCRSIYQSVSQKI